MRGIINNIITFYRIQAKALGILITNTQKALEESDGKRKANEQAEKMENFVKDVAIDLDNMLARFYFHKERRQMTDAQTKALGDFANFVKALTKNVCSLLARFQKGQTFEEKIDKEIKEIETHVKQKLKEYDEALTGKSNTTKKHLGKYVGKIVSGVAKSFKEKSFTVAEKR